MTLSAGGEPKVEIRKVKISGKEAGTILEACESAKSLRNATVIITFKNSKMQQADVNRHFSRLT